MLVKKAYITYYKYLLLSLVLTIIGALIAEDVLSENKINPVAMIIVVIGSLMIVSYSKGYFKRIMFYIFCLLEGFFLNPVLKIYTDSSLVMAVGMTLLVLIIFSIIGYKVTLKPGFGKYLYVALLSIIIYLLARMFIPLPSISFIIIIVFSLWVIYDTNKFLEKAKNENISNDEIIDSVIEIYLDILNIFLNILEIFGDSD